jgi:uncharacterized protein (DUF302 family)
VAPPVHRALAADPHTGLLLPCSVVVLEAGDATSVSIADPCAMFRIVENAEVAPIADEEEAKLKLALERRWASVLHRRHRGGLIQTH